MMMNHHHHRQKKMKTMNWKTNSSRKRRRSWWRKWKPIPSPEVCTRTKRTRSTTKTWPKSSSGARRSRKRVKKRSKTWPIKTRNSNARRRLKKSNWDESNTKRRERNERKRETRKWERKRWKARKSWKRKRRSFTSTSCYYGRIFDTKTVERNRSILCWERCTARRLRAHSKAKRNSPPWKRSTKNSTRKTLCSNTWRRKICRSWKTSAWTCWNSSTKRPRRRRNINFFGRASIAWRKQN